MDYKQCETPSDWIHEIMKSEVCLDMSGCCTLKNLQLQKDNQNPTRGDGGILSIRVNHG